MSLHDPGLVGIWLLAVAAVVIVIELALAGVWSVRLSKRAQQLNEQRRHEQAELEADVEHLQEAIAETVALWQPYRRLLRWLRHPLTVALLQSYARRRVAAR